MAAGRGADARRLRAVVNSSVADGGSIDVILGCAEEHQARVRYTLDSLFMAMQVRPVYRSEVPSDGVYVYYGIPPRQPRERGCVYVMHSPGAWDDIHEGRIRRREVPSVDVPFVVGECADSHVDIPFDILANAFYFLCSWDERSDRARVSTRRLYENSIYAREGIPQDIVDRYLALLIDRINRVRSGSQQRELGTPQWSGGKAFAIVLSHDIDFLPTVLLDNVWQGGKTILRHLVRQKRVGDAATAARKLLTALSTGRDPYGCVPQILAREQDLGVRASYQVAVAKRHPQDVNYRVEDDRVTDYLRVIDRAGFDLCLHGSYRSTERPEWYEEEVELLSQRLARPRGSRQHFLSFDYDNLFAAQERSGIHYDMSMGYPDRTGPRAGFSFPYFPYCLSEDRPYNVVEISLFIMDVTLSSYADLRGDAAWERIESELEAIRRKGGGVSVVWHPIVFGGARDPGYDELYWRLVHYVVENNGWASDGRDIDAFWRARATDYASFSSLGAASGPNDRTE